jgi:hypothetical protein
MIGVPVVLGLLFAWQMVAPLLRADSAVRDAVGISRVSLETDPIGTRIDLVMVDRVGQDTTVTGDLNLTLREPDGTLWQTSRSVSPADFGVLAAGGLLSGRTGLTVVVPAKDWIRPPRRGGATTVTVSVQPSSGAVFSTVEEARFP